MTDLKPKERMQIPRQDMPRQSVDDRIVNFDEVALGLDREAAMREADRCLECKDAKCVPGCPVEIDIPKFVVQVREGDFEGALETIRETNILPAICGRVCPQEDQCEATCIVGKKNEPVAIGRLERFVADWEVAHGEMRAPACAPSTGHKVAIVGSGPAGLTCAAELARRGHSVTVFEALHKPGGVLMYGIPQFRLPKEILEREVKTLEQMGVEVRCNFVIGKTATIEELREEYGYEAVFIGTGAGLPYFMGIPGENLIGVLSSNEFLTRVNLMRGYRFPEYDTPIKVGNKIAVVGSGNTAMDCLRGALRLGADEVFCIYRRSRNESPARIEELEHAEEEGIDFRWLTNPVEVLGDEDGRVRGVRVIKMELGEPDDSGRRRPIPIEGSEYEIELDTLVVAIGQGPNPLVQDTTPGLEVNRWGNIVADEETGQTSLPGVFAGGDIVTGAATVILAMGAGRKAAANIHGYLIDGTVGETASD